MSRRRILTFSTKDVVPLVGATRKARLHRAVFGQLFDPRYHRDQTIKLDAHGFPDADNIDATLIPPSLWLVKDQGVYLMSSAALERELAPGESLPLAYARECNPETLPFDDWYENARNIVGGDDCVEALPIEWFERAVEEKAASIRLQLLARSIRLVR